MVEYHWLSDAEPVLRYFIVTVGFSLVLLVSLLMCAKKGKQDHESNGGTFTSYSNPIIEAADTTTTVQEELIVPVIESDVRSKPDDVSLDVKKDSPSAVVAHPESFIIPPQNSGNVLPVEPNEQHENLDLTKTNNPLPTYVSIKSTEKIQENSGSGNSDSSIYTKVKDVPVKEENAYAIVDIKFDQTYDVINGNLVNVRKLEINEPNEKFSEPIYEPSDSSYYDKPNCIATQNFEEENSGASGYYASVSNNNNKLVIIEDLNITNSDLYESCGPGQGGDNNVCNTSNHMVNDTYNDDTYDSINVIIPKSQLDNPRRSSVEILTGELSNCDKKEGGKVEKHSKFSILNPFKGSKKHKSEENHVIDIREDNTDTNEGNAPPLPSVDKLKHLTSQRKCQTSLSDQSGSPVSSPSASPRSLKVSREVSLEEPDTNAACNHRDIRLGHRPRHSDGNILPLIPDPSFQKENQNALRNSLKSTNTPPRMVTCTIHDDNTVTASENKAIHSQNIILTIEKTVVDTFDQLAARNYVIDDPNYEEIETTKTYITDDINANNPPVAEGNDGSVINGDHPPVAERDGEVSSGYATVDFGKKQDDRRIKNLYATIDYSCKKIRTDDNVISDNATMYDGTYDVIPDNTESVLAKEVVNNGDEEFESIPTKEELNNEDDDVDDKYEELTAFQNS